MAQNTRQLIQRHDSVEKGFIVGRQAFLFDIHYCETCFSHVFTTLVGMYTCAKED